MLDWITAIKETHLSVINDSAKVKADRFRSSRQGSKDVSAILVNNVE